MHKGDENILGDKTEQKVSSGESNRKETKILKSVLDKEGGVRFYSSGYTQTPTADCWDNCKEPANYINCNGFLG
jgi:hypothetical protein